jgi:Ca2+:H+ antiporter
MKFKIEPLDWLLPALPVAVVLDLVHAGPVPVFAVSCLAIVPLAGLMGRATEALAHTLGAGVGGLLNATFGNAAELIIALMLLRKGPGQYDMVKASLTGSIIGNVLLVLGVSVAAGGALHKKQTFNRTAASMGATLLSLAAVGLLVPTLYFHVFAAGRPSDEALGKIESLSEEIAVVLLVLYGLSLLFTLRTHQHLFAGPEDEVRKAEDVTEPAWGRRTALIVLAVATAGVALMSEFLADTVKDAAARFGMNQVFVGVIVLAVVGNAAEHSTAVVTAVKNKMDLSVNISIGSSIQIALFVAPVLVFASILLNPGRPLDLHFSLMEVIAVGLSVFVLALVSQDGESHWMEGAMLLGVYLIFALAFYHLPAAAF